MHRCYFLLLCGDNCRKGVAWASITVVGVHVCMCTVEFSSAWVAFSCAFCVAVEEFFKTK